MNENYLVDGFCRAILLESLSNSSYKNSALLKEYILHEAPYDKILSSVVFGRVLSEQEMDVNTDAKLRAAEGVMSGLLSFGAFLVAEPINKSITDRIFKGVTNYETILGKKGEIIKMKGTNQAATKAVWTAGKGGKWATRMGRLGRGMVGSMVGGMLLSFGAGLLVKALFAVIRGMFSKCKSQCETMVPTALQERDSQVSVCISKCKITGLTQQVNRLRGEIGRCVQTKNPEKCKLGLTKQVAKLNDVIEDENNRLRKVQMRLAAKIRKKMAPKPIR